MKMPVGYARMPQRGFSRGLVFVVVAGIVGLLAAVARPDKAAPTGVRATQDLISPAEGQLRDAAAAPKDVRPSVQILGHTTQDAYVVVTSGQEPPRSEAITVLAKSKGFLPLVPGRYSVDVAYLDPASGRTTGTAALPVMLVTASSAPLLDLTRARATRLPFPTQDAYVVQAPAR